MADIDADGNLDLLSGSWPGELFVFRGFPGRDFAPPETLKNREGKEINIGGGLRDSGDGMILIAGNATFEEDEEGQYLLYQGEKIRVPEGRSAGITGTASSLCVNDWDHDGDFDLIVGNIQGELYLVPNEGTPQEPAFSKEESLKVGDEEIRVAGDAGPTVADWDGDGLNDLVVGMGDGKVVWFRNQGTATEPRLAGERILVAASEQEYGNPPSTPTPGMRTKPCVADFNGDGRPDLLVGDYGMQKPPAKDYTEAEKAEQEALRAERDKLRESLSKIQNQLFSPRRKPASGSLSSLLQGLLGDQPLNEEELKELREEYADVSRQYSEVSAKLPEEYEDHGWVWLYLRKPASDTAAEN